MAVIAWPTARHFQPSEFRLTAQVPKSAFSAAYTGQTQELSHAADRLLVGMTLGPCYGTQAAEREAYLMALASTGDWVRLWHFQRPQPLGTLRGSPVTSAAAAAGARSLSITTTAGATLRGGDLLGANDQLVMAAFAGATANGSGAMTLPLVLPLRKAIGSGVGLAWNQPVGGFKLIGNVQSSYTAPRLALGVDLVFLEQF